MTLGNAPIQGRQAANRSTTASSSSSSQPTSSNTYISNTELADGRQALLVDTGSYGNLTGAPWARRTTTLALRHKRKSKQTKRAKPLNVSGVGKDAQTCTHDCELPVELQTIDGRQITGVFTAPTINDHSLPAILGLKTLIERRAIMDFTTMQLSFTGPGQSRIEYSPGTDTFQMLHAPSGHLMLPCCDYRTPPNNVTGTMSLLNVSQPNPESAQDDGSQPLSEVPEPAQGEGIAETEVTPH